MNSQTSFNASRFIEALIEKTDATTVREGLKKVLAGLNDYEMNGVDFREILNHMYDGIYISDGNGKTLFVNEAYCKITGIKPEQVVGKNVKEIEGYLYKNAVTLEVIKHKKQVNSVGESLVNSQKMLITGKPIFDQAGNVKMVVIIDREMTDLMEMKAELESSQHKLKVVKEHERKSRQEIEHLRKLSFKNVDLIGVSQSIKDLTKIIDQVAGADVTVLITGETGVGKEVVANEIYANSSRKDGPFIKVNCAAIPSNLLEAELFGYEKGAFTGANVSGKAGLFELAHKGTILLDEIGEMSIDLQSKLLRVIQHQEITRIGGTKPIKLNVRILSATNRDLKELVKNGDFREDLYYRLNVFPIYIPPLRLRTEDIEVLTRHFIDMLNKKYGKSITIGKSGIELLQHYSWPGNVRELQNVLERLVIVNEHDAIIDEQQLENILNVDFNNLLGLLNKEAGLKEIVENIERKTLEKVLAQCKNTREAAKILKIDQSTIVKKAKKLGIKLKR